MAMRGFGSRFLRMPLRHDHMKNALKAQAPTGADPYTCIAQKDKIKKAPDFHPGLLLLP
ncbi:MAG: hypothetical protein FWD61_06730 [Phycisphaerales bacterium]|nr:hypothetical protein [Phycisphaerales bacterium]